MDIDFDKLSVIEKLVSRMVYACGVPVKIKSGTELPEALKGADFVILQIRVEGLNARYRDETVLLNSAVSARKLPEPEDLPVPLGQFLPYFIYVKLPNNTVLEHG
jgi:hypothetical protein